MTHHFLGNSFGRACPGPRFAILSTLRRVHPIYARTSPVSEQTTTVGMAHTGFQNARLSLRVNYRVRRNYTAGYGFVRSDTVDYTPYTENCPRLFSSNPAALKRYLSSKNIFQKHITLLLMVLILSASGMVRGRERRSRAQKRGCCTTS